MRIDRSSPRTSAAALAARVPPPVAASIDRSRLGPLARERLVGLRTSSASGASAASPRRPSRSSAREPGALGLEAGDDPGIHELATVTLHRPAPFGEHAASPRARSRSCSTRTSESLDVAVAAGRQLGLGRHHRRVEPGQLPPQLTLLRLRARRWSPASACSRVRRPAISRPARNRRSAGELADQLAVAAGGLGLPLERPELAADLPQQVLDPQQVALGRLEAALGLLLALAVLEDAGRLLDDRPAILGPGVEHGVDLALADDHVLLAADAGVGQQLLHVEQPARHAVDRVLALARAEQRAR